MTTAEEIITSLKDVFETATSGFENFYKEAGKKEKGTDSTAASSIGSGLESNNDSPAQCPRGMGTSPNGDCYCRARVTSWRRAARRLQASPGSPICVLPG